MQVDVQWNLCRCIWYNLNYCRRLIGCKSEAEGGDWIPGGSIAPHPTSVLSPTSQNQCKGFGMRIWLASRYLFYVKGNMTAGAISNSGFNIFSCRWGWRRFKCADPQLPTILSLSFHAEAHTGQTVLHPNRPVCISPWGHCRNQQKPTNPLLSRYLWSPNSYWKWLHMRWVW